MASVVPATSGMSPPIVPSVPFNSMLKVGKSRSVSLALVSDGLMAVEGALSDQSPTSGSSIFCSCNVGLLRPDKAPTFTSIPYYHILNVRFSNSSLKIAYATPKSSRHSNTTQPSILYRLPVRLATAEFSIPDGESQDRVEKWADELRARAYERAKPGRRIYVILNPFGGKGRARELWDDEIRPFLQAAGCHFELRETEYRGHAVEIARQLDPDAWDVVACCSGDGVVYEVFNGLAQQPNQVSTLAKISVVQLPCGSGNAMSFNLTGSVDPSAATIVLLKGASVPLDLMSVSQGGKRTISFLSQSVGMIADCDVGTDELRWMGPARFTLGVVWKILNQSTYPCEIALPPSCVRDKVKLESEFTAAEALTTDTAMPSPDATTKSNPITPVLLPDSPMVSESAGSLFKPLTPAQTAASGPAEGRDAEDLVGTTSSSVFVDALDGQTGESGVPFGSMPLRYGTEQSEVPSDWIRLSRPDLGTLYAGNMAYMADDAHFFPISRPADGLIDLVLISGRMGRLNGLKAVTAIENGPKFFRLPMVEYIKTDVFRVIPRVDPKSADYPGQGNGNGCISIDGEPAPLTPFQVEIHKGMGRVISLFGTSGYAPGYSWD